MWTVKVDGKDVDSGRGKVFTVYAKTIPAGKTAVVTAKSTYWESTFTINVVYKPGDIDGSGTVDNDDAKMLLKHLSGSTQLDEEQYARADVYGDGDINMLDVIAIL